MLLKVSGRYLQCPDFDFVSNRINDRSSVQKEKKKEKVKKEGEDLRVGEKEKEAFHRQGILQVGL